MLCNFKQQLIHIAYIYDTISEADGILTKPGKVTNRVKSRTCSPHIRITPDGLKKISRVTHRVELEKFGYGFR
jgi:hypothetical protein